MNREQQVREGNVRRTIAEFIAEFIRSERQATRRDNGGRKSYGHLLREAEREAYANAERCIREGRT